MILHWSGFAIFVTLTDRDTWLGKFRSYSEGNPNCVAAPNRRVAEGLVALDNRSGNVMTGPAFSWSFNVADAELAMWDGPAWIIHYDLSELPETVAESGAITCGA